MTPSPASDYALRPLKLRDFDFGSASAGTEATQRPELLEQGFLDHQGMEEEAINGTRFLFLGYKGSGKSALGERLVLLSRANPMLFVRMPNIADLSFQSFSQILKGSAEPEARYPTVWSWLLLLQVFDSFANDHGCNAEREVEIWAAFEALREAGMLPDPKLAETVRTTLEGEASVKLMGVLNLSIKAGVKRNCDLPFIVERLKQVAGRLRTESKHIVLVDGFDDLLRRRNLQYDALGALVFEAHRLNNHFTRSGVPAKIILLCRTDLFDRLPGPNNNKIRADFAVNLEWSYRHNDARQAPLVQLINRRANMNRSEPVDVFEKLLPEFQPDVKGKMEIRRYLLEHTRYVPRDMVMLFQKLQEFSGDGRMTTGQVFNAIANYSKSYFVQEIRDELDGQVDLDDIGRAFRLFSSVRKRTAQVAEFESRARQLHYPTSFNVRRILGLLFECSAVGNAPSAVAHPKDTRFRHKNPYSDFDERQHVVFHQALWAGLDLH